MDTQKAAQQLVQTSAERRDLIVQFKIDAGSVGRRLTRRAEAQMRTRKPRLVLESRPDRWNDAALEPTGK